MARPRSLDGLLGLNADTTGIRGFYVGIKFVAVEFVSTVLCGSRLERNSLFSRLPGASRIDFCYYN